jgi:transmembrane sensor
MIDEAACQWASRLDRGLDHGEQTSLAAWLAADGRHSGALLRAQAALSLLDRGRALATTGGTDEDLPAPARRHAFRIGAGLVAVLAAASGWRLWHGSERIETAVGEIRRVPLADGSLAVVNSGSRLRVAFTERDRAIELAAGEAWFHVARNAARPFTVSAGTAVVQAVGTAFNVRKWPQGTQVTVTEGVVKVWSSVTPGSHMLVDAGHRAFVRDRAPIAVAAITPAASERQLAWREGRVVLDNMTLAAAAAEFNRYHSDRLVIDPALEQQQVVGWFDTDDIDGFARASAAMVGARVERHGTVIRITP